MKKIITYSIFWGTLISFLFLFFSCEENSLNPTLDKSKEFENLKNFDDASTVLIGLYDRLTSSYYYGRDVIIYGECRSDNAFSNGNSGRFITVSDMKMVSSGSHAKNTWQILYQVISSANILIQAKSLIQTDEEKNRWNHMLGQAYAVRALAHFDLIRIYGQQHVGLNRLNALGVPYVKTFKKENRLLPPRNTVDEVKNFVYEDFKTAIGLMESAPEEDNKILNEYSKQYLTSYTAYALWSRAAIYFGDYVLSKIAAESVISSKKFEIVKRDQFVESWQEDGSSNSIFELAFSVTDNNDLESLAYIYRGSSYGDIQAFDSIINIFDSKDTIDIRGSKEMISKDSKDRMRNIGKYPSSTIDVNVNIIRYEEVILNYAEALFETGDKANALIWLNKIPFNRIDPVKLYTQITKENILLERRKELCFEGLRFDDMVRTKQSIPYINPEEKGPLYGSYRYAFPIPNHEINTNPNMVQNKGY